MTPALQLEGIVKRFDAISAVDGVTLSVAPGEVLALVGENGAGKSTLVAIASGLYRADAGEVLAFGNTLAPADPRAAIEAGIGVVHQHFMLIGPLRVWENAVLGQEPRRFGTIDAARARREVAATARRFGLAVDVDARVESLSVAAQQRVEIVKQLWRGARILFLDEPTAVLSPLEADELKRTLRALADDGRAVVFISHKLREVLAVADRIAVLRRGKLVAVTARAQVDEAQLTEAIMGAFVPSPSISGAPRPRPTRIPARASDTLLEARDLTTPGRPGLRGLSFRLAAGECLGIAGVDGNGQVELAEVLTGLRRWSGSLRLEAAEAFPRTPAAARSAGVVHLPEDRQRTALCLPLSAGENLALGQHRAKPWARGPLIDRVGRRERSGELLRSFDVRPPDSSMRAADLSGGNQQKLVVARELGTNPPPRLVVAMHPTRGLDPGATQRVHGALRSAQRAGAALVVISLDLDELRALADRIAVVFEGQIAGELPPDATDEQLGRFMLGEGRAHA